MSLFKFISRKLPFQSVILEGKIRPQQVLITCCKASTFQYTDDKDPAPLFFSEDTQCLLKTLTRPDVNKIFRKRKLGAKKLDLPVYKFMTDEQLEKAQKEAQERAEDIMQMPPVVSVRKPINTIINKEPALEGYDTCKFVFTDITFGIQNNERIITVREQDGTLSKAEWDLRDRMNQVYFPIEGRELNIPKMFQEIILKKLLDKKKYEFVLDRACLQFEPNNPEYQKITSMVYLHINENGDYESLRSTRHFGPLVFFLIWFNKIDNLLLELIETAHMDDAKVLIRLYGRIHKVKFDLSGEDIVERYIGEVAEKRGPLELALQAYKELEKERIELEKGIKKAHGFS